MASVLFENVYKRFGDVEVVTDANLEIADREFIVLTGPSGCGKSTLLRMLAGLEDITEGSILVGDRVVNNVPPHDRDIAMVFQDNALYPNMSVYDNLAFGLQQLRVPKAEIDRRVKEVSDILGLSFLLDRKPKALSGGQRHRVAVGYCIVREPAVFLMDEPLSNLYPKLRNSARAEISQLHRRLGTTFIYVTGDQVEAMTMGDRIAVMSDGILQQVDTPRNLYNEPSNVFVAGYIGSPSINFFDATLLGESGLMYADTGDFRVQIPDDLKTIYNSYLGKEVILGIRPEHIYSPNYAQSDINAAPISGTVEVVELIGHELHLYVNSGRNLMVALVDTRLLASPGNEIDLVIDMNQIHLFDKDTELAIR